MARRMCDDLQLLATSSASTSPEREQSVAATSPNFSDEMSKGRREVLHYKDVGDGEVEDLP